MACQHARMPPCKAEIFAATGVRDRVKGRGGVKTIFYASRSLRMLKNKLIRYVGIPIAFAILCGACERKPAPAPEHHWAHTYQSYDPAGPRPGDQAIAIDAFHAQINETLRDMIGLQNHIGEIHWDTADTVEVTTTSIYYPADDFTPDHLEAMDHDLILWLRPVLIANPKAVAAIGGGIKVIIYRPNDLAIHDDFAVQKTDQ